MICNQSTQKNAQNLKNDHKSQHPTLNLSHAKLARAFSLQLRPWIDLLMVYNLSFEPLKMIKYLVRYHLSKFNKNMPWKPGHGARMSVHSEHGAQLRGSNFMDPYLDEYFAKINDSKLVEEISWRTTRCTL